MKQKLLTFLLLGLFAISSAFAQVNRTVTGKVVGADDGLPLPGVSVRVKGSAIGTTTGSDGNYSLSVPAGARTITFTYIGYSAMDVAIGSSNTINVRGLGDAQQLSEVVVTGYGVQRKRDVIGTISSISGEKIQNQPIPSVDKALQGRVAGVLVQSNNGIPGGGINVRIRGVGSISAGNQPLYVVDGIQLNTRDDASFTQSNPLAFLNSSDIQSIEVLKDAATAAIYGAQGANGVVLITTKKGKAGKTNFNFGSYYGSSAILKKLDVLNTQDYLTLRTEANENRFRDGYEANRRYVLTSEMQIPNAATLTDAEIAALPSYDWQDEVTQSGNIQNYELGVSGGNDKTTFYIGSSYNVNEAVFKKVDFRRGTLKLDLQNKATQKLTLNTSLNLSTFSQAAPFATDGSSLGSPAFSSSLIVPSNRVRNVDGSYFGLLGSGSAFPGILNQNIASVTDFNSADQRTNQAVGSVSATYDILKNLIFKSYYGLDYRLVQGRSYRDPRTADAFARRGLGQVQSSWNTNFLTTQTLNFSKQIDNHAFNVLGGFEYKAEQQQSISASADGYPSPQFRYLNSAANPLGVGEFFSEFKRISGFGKIDYNYKSKYLIGLTARYDGSSRFGADNQFGLFPSVQLGWNIKSEGFMNDLNAISSLKLRASYGTAGNDQIGNFDSRGLYSSGSVYNGASGINPTALPNPSLKWERNQTVNLGLDFGFFNERLSGSIEVYDRLSNDLLLAQPLQVTSGFNGFTSNVGQLQNKGIELDLNSVNLDTEWGFKWSTNFNIAHNKNEVKKLYGGLNALASNTSVRVGYPLGAIFTQRYAGVNPATGRPLFYNINNEVTYLPIAADRVVIGDTQPEFYGGFNNTFNYKGFGLDFLFQYEYGRLVSDGQVSFLSENGNRQFNTLQDIYNARWTTPGQITSVPRPFDTGVEGQGANAVIGSDRIFFKADYIRLKNITFSYSVPKKFLSKSKLGSAKLYVQGTNLFTYDDFPGYDPEFIGAGTGIIPQSKNYTFGVQIGF